MTTTNDSTLYDKSGKLVRRHDGIAADGDRLVVGMRLMDAASVLTNVTLRDAEDDAPATREQLDAAYQARCARMEDAWRQPEQHDVERPTPAATADDAIAQRNRRLENAWRG